MRLDTVVVDDKAKAQSTNVPSQRRDTIEPDGARDDEIDVGAALGVWSRRAAGRTEAVAYRAFAILKMAKTLPEQKTAGELAGDMANATGRILAQSAKILKRCADPLGGRRGTEGQPEE